MSSEKKVAVIIPCLNEEMTVGGVVKSFRKALPEADVYVYDNNSEDLTASEALKAGAKLRFCSTPGKGAVLREAFYEVNADIYVLVDGDGTYPPDKVPEMIALYEKNPKSVVLGNRVIEGKKRAAMSASHAAGNFFLSMLFRCLYGFHDVDILTGSRVFGQNFAKNFPARFDGFETETEMAIFAWSRKFDVCTVDVPYRKRPAGSKSKIDTFRDGARIVRLALVGRRGGI